MHRRSLTLAIAALGVAVTSARAELIAYYNFEGNANNVAPGHTGTYDGTPTNGPTLVAGFSGQGYSFDGSNDYIAVPLNINPAAMPKLTIGAWVKSESRSGIQQIISHDDGGYDRSIGIDYRGSSNYNFSTFAGSGGVLNSNYYSTAWTFVASVYDAPASSVKLYINGALAASTTGSGTTGWTNLRIGTSTSFNEYFRGTIDNVFFYNEALDASAIAGLYVNGGPASVHFPGDTNNDGVVDLVDLNNVLNNFGATGANPGDDNADGTVDLADLNNVLNNFGATHAASALSVVPEPASLSVLAIGATSLLIRRRRSR